MLKVRNGDLDKLSLLFERYKKQLFVFFYKMTNDSQLSEDLVQNVFIRVLKYRRTFRGEGAFKVWLFHIGRNEFYDHHRRNKNNISLGPADEDLTNHREDEQDREKEFNLKLLKIALNRLKVDRKEVIMLSKIDGLKYSEIARILNCTEGTVKSKVFRALKELREEFTKVSQHYEQG